MLIHHVITYLQIKQNFCDISNTLLCQPRVTVGIRALKTASTQLCTGSLAAVSSISCGAIAAQGCQIALSDFLYITCASGSTLNSTGFCNPIAATNVTIVAQNQNCGTCPTGIPCICPNNMACINGICRVQSQIGQLCNINFGTQLSCESTLVCEAGICQLPSSKTEGQQCTQNAICSSGKCSNNLCEPVSRQSCMTNVDCSTPYSVCDRRGSPTADSYGTCYTPSLLLANALATCTFNYYINVPAIPTLDQAFSPANCSTQLVQYLCSQYCTQSLDLRINTAYGPYVYDCAAFTRRKLTPGVDCQIIQQFLNCDLSLFASSIKNGFSFGMLMFLIIHICLSLF